jgi:hypothetical protein
LYAKWRIDAVKSVVCGYIGSYQYEKSRPGIVPAAQRARRPRWPS